MERDNNEKINDLKSQLSALNSKFIYLEKKLRKKEIKKQIQKEIKILF